MSPHQVDLVEEVQEELERDAPHPRPAVHRGQPPLPALALGQLSAKHLAIESEEEE
jgi:hypothetical protein